MGRGEPIAVIGTGRIGSVLAQAWSRAGLDVIISGRNLAAADALASCHAGVRCLPLPEALAECRVMVLAIPPAAYLPLLQAWADRLAPECIVVSLTNGVTLEAIGKATRNPLVKLVPTLAQTVQRGAMPVIAGPHAALADVEAIMALAALIGRPVLVQDEDARVASNVAGSALAIMSRLGEAFVASNADRAIHLGEADLMAMMAETFGAISDLVSRGHALSDIIAATATPEGVTHAQLAVLDADVHALAERIVAASFARQTSLQSDSQERMSP